MSKQAKEEIQGIVMTVALIAVLVLTNWVMMLI